jgi:predicted nucleic acid-binding protein
VKNRTIIVDTSVIIKWLLPDEDESLAGKIKQAFATKDLAIAIPYLTYYEVSNVLAIAVKRKRISEETSKKLFTAFLDLEFIVYATKELFTRSLAKSLEFTISSYDASYIALAEYLRVSFVTADKKLLNKVSSKFVIDLKEYTV